MLKKTVFLDRDGTINEYKPYLSDYKDLKLIEGSANAIKLLKENNFKIYIVTNQSGINRGFFSKESVESLNRKLTNILFEKGAYIDGIFYCPHLPDDDCNCRKPKTGMFEACVKDYKIDLNNSYMVGDNISDIEAGLEFGCNPILVKTGLGQSTYSNLNSKFRDSVVVCNNLYEATTKFILD